MAELIATEPIARWIMSLDIGAQEPIAFERVGAGQSNLTYLVTDGVGHEWILRRPPLGKLLASAHDIAREHRIMSGLQGTGVPVPPILGFTTDPDVTDAPTMLMGYVAGNVLDDLETAQSVSAPTRRAIGMSLASTLGKIHAVDLDRAGLIDLAKHTPYAERQLRRWHRQWEQSRMRELPIVDDLAARLTANIPEQTELSLVHGDFHLMNVITDPVEGDVLAVLDWELSTLGDPLADLGGMLAYWPQADDEVIAGFAGPTLPGFPTRDELVAEYARTTGRDVSAIGFWHVLGLWKTAIIVEGVVRRAKDDPRNTAVSGGLTIELVEQRLQRAETEARKVGI